MFSDITSGAGACQIGCAVCPGEAAHAAAATPPVQAAPAPDWRHGSVGPRRQLVVPEDQRFCASHACGAACVDHGHGDTARPANDDDGDRTLMAAE
ncbi:hypothetical protein ACFONL_13795 [Camelimonas fluminis]|uniref:Uncharacterized protein n=1 Tax=Camelimonas fluminis TaxID=1576911 RepID=A0ABV7UJE4_9HYPH|nr:hypothetical protein [Camelimonas fluminis]